MTAEREPHLTLWNVGPQQIHVAFDGGRVVSDAGLLAVRALEKPLRVIADLAERLPDPRSQSVVSRAPALQREVGARDRGRLDQYYSGVRALARIMHRAMER